MIIVLMQSTFACKETAKYFSSPQTKSSWTEKTAYLCVLAKNLCTKLNLDHKKWRERLWGDDPMKKLALYGSVIMILDEKKRKM